MTGLDDLLATAKAEGLSTPGMVLADGQIGRSTGRHPRVRTGERDPIPLHVRAAVWYRDRGLCAECPKVSYRENKAVHLDHIKLWSAGGTDTTDNLRILCERHNVDRSNFVDWAQPKRPATWWCHRCHDLRYEYVGEHLLRCPIHPNSGFGGKYGCRVVKAIERWEDARWFQMPPPPRTTRTSPTARTATRQG